MAISVTRLDGQNVGLRLSGGSLTTPIFSVDLSTGAVSSTVLSINDCQNLRAGALALFNLVPLAERSTITFLNRLLTVTAADSSALSLTASIVGTVSTLVATVAGTPANLLVHLPYTPDGLLAWASGGGTGGVVVSVGASEPLASSGGANPIISFGGTTFTSPGTGTFVAGEVLTLNAAGSLIKATVAGATNRRTVVGIASTGDVAATTKVFNSVGNVTEVRFSVAPGAGDIGKDVFLSTVAGRASLTAPAGPAQRVYRLGTLSSTTLGPAGGYPIVYQPQVIVDL